MKRQTFIKAGDKFNRLTAVRYSHTGKHQRRYFVFLCDCGNEITVTAEAAISGNTKSCGCIRRDAVIRRYNLRPGWAAMHQVVLQYKRHCRDRSHEWDLSDEQFYELTQRNCFYCGAEPATIKKSDNNTGDFIYNGIDRLDSQRGYYADNVVPCCRICNTAKSDMPVEVFIAWIRRVYKHIDSTMAQQWGHIP